MPYTRSDVRPIDSIVRDLWKSQTEEKSEPRGDDILIAKEFQRGDEKTGIWTKRDKTCFLDSIKEGFPVGILTFVKNCGGAHHSPWMILDGANRARTLRDFLNGNITDGKSKKFDELGAEEKAKFKTRTVPCEWVRIERGDHPDIIAKMFCRLNTSATPLSQGELIKARGWLNNVPIIELAKHFTGWYNTFERPDEYCLTQNDVELIYKLKDIWDKCIGKISETKRCDNLAMFCGYIISAFTGQFNLFDKRFEKLSPYFQSEWTEENFQKVKKAIIHLINIMHKIGKDTKLNTIFKINKGLIPKAHIAPIWYAIITNFAECPMEKIVEFYRGTTIDSWAQAELKKILKKGGNNEMGLSKMQNALRYINENSATDETSDDSDDSDDD